MSNASTSRMCVLSCLPETSTTYQIVWQSSRVNTPLKLLRQFSNASLSKSSKLRELYGQPILALHPRSNRTHKYCRGAIASLPQHSVSDKGGKSSKQFAKLWPQVIEFHRQFRVTWPHMWTDAYCATLSMSPLHEDAQLHYAKLAHMFSPSPSKQVGLA